MTRSPIVLVLFTISMVFAAPWPSATIVASAQEGSTQDVAPAPAQQCFDADDHPTCPTERMQADVTKLAQANAQLGELTAGGRYRLQEGILSFRPEQLRATVLIMLEVNALVRAEVGPFFAQFEQRYGRPDPNYSDGRLTLGGRLSSLDHRVSSNFNTLRELLRQIRESGATSARVCLRAETFQLERMDHINSMLRGRVMNGVQAMLEICPQFDPANEQVTQQVAALRPRVTALLQQYAEEELEAARGHHWERSVARVNGGAAATLERAALAYLRAHEDGSLRSRRLERGPPQHLWTAGAVGPACTRRHPQDRHPCRAGPGL